MFSNEHDYVKQVERLLREEGYSTKREVRIRAGYRLDILATKDGVKKGFEVKIERRGLLDDLMKSQRLARLPDLDEMYVCGPKMLISEDVLASAEQLGIGLLAGRDDGKLEWLTRPRKLDPASLILGGSGGGGVEPGGEAKFTPTVFNNGGKAAVDLEVRMVMAGPFVARYPSRARAKHALLDGHDQWTTTLTCNVKRDAKPGKYPLVVSLTAANTKREDSTVPFEVKPAPTRSK